MANWFKGLGEFAGGVAEGWDPWLKLSAEEKREREKLEAEAGGYGDLLAELRRGEVTEDPRKPFVTPAGKDVLPTLESRPLTRQQLIRGGIAQKGKIGILEKRMALARADKIRQEREEREDEQEERTRLEREQTRFDAAAQAKELQGTYKDRAAATIRAAQTTSQQKLSAEARGLTAQGAIPPSTYMPKGEGFTERPISPSDLIRMSAQIPGAKRTAAQELREQQAKEKLDLEEKLSKITTRPSGTPLKPSDKVAAKKENAKLRIEYNKPETTEAQREILAGQALDNFPILYDASTKVHTIDNAHEYLQGRGLPSTAGITRTEEPESVDALSSEETDHLNAARNMQRAKNLYMAKYSDKEAKKNLTIQGQFTHWIKNVVGPAAGLDAWKDPRAARFFAEAENLTAKALQQTHQMMGGGAFSEPDRILYERTIPNTKTYSPVAYKAKLEAWSDGLDDYVDYMTARQKIAGLPRLVSEMEPWQVIKHQGKKGEDGKEIISKGMAKMLIEHKLGLNPDTNKKWTGEALLDYQKEHKDKGFTIDDLLEFIPLLPYDVPPPSR